MVTGQGKAEEMMNERLRQHLDSLRNGRSWAYYDLTDMECLRQADTRGWHDILWRIAGYDVEIDELEACLKQPRPSDWKPKTRKEWYDFRVEERRELLRREKAYWDARCAESQARRAA